MSEREPITGELREAVEWEPTFCGPDRAMVSQPEFDRICDAIDAVHAGLERENAELHERLAVLDESADSMHDGWVRLPVDVDGVPIRVGDKVEYVNDPDKPRTVSYLYLANDGWWVYNNGVGRRPDKYRHHHAPTVEDVLREMHAELDEVTALYVGEAIDSDERDRDEARIFAEYAKRLTLAWSDAE